MSEISKIYDIDKILELHKKHKGILKFIDALDEFVLNVLKNIDVSKLAPLETQGHETYFSKLYNSWIQGKKLEHHELARLAHHLSSDLQFGRILIQPKNSLKKNKEALTKFFLEGLRKTSVDLVWHECSKCEKQHSLYVKNENFVMLPFLNKGPFTPCGISKKSEKINITLKTGNLLIMDFFRSNSELFNAGKHASMNTEIGKLERTQNLFKKYNLLSVSVGNTSPAIFQKGNSIIFPQDEENVPKGYNKKGRVVTDFWGVSIIEEENLLSNLIASGKTKKEATAEIKKLKSNWFVNYLKVSPGIYEFRFPVKEEYTSPYHKKIFKGSNVLISLQKKVK